MSQSLVPEEVFFHFPETHKNKKKLKRKRLRVLIDQRLFFHFLLPGNRWEKVLIPVTDGQAPVKIGRAHV